MFLALKCLKEVIPAIDATVIRRTAMLLRPSAQSTSKVPERVEPRPQRGLPSKENLTWKRYEGWRIARDVGLPDDRGVLRTQPVWLIAMLYRVSERTVWHGIKLAVDARTKALEEAKFADEFADPV
jgi:hypothetical protein